MTSVWTSDLFKGKRVVITGGTSGIGLGITLRFAELGADLLLLARNEERLADTKRKVEALGGTATTVSLDVRKEDAVEAAAKEWGTTDVLINCAAGNFPIPFAAMTQNAWKSVMDIVVQGTVNVTRAFGQPMYEAGQPLSMINIVAGYAWTGAPGVSHSGAAKAAVLNLTKSLAVEWAPHVRANAVSPGPIGGTEGMKRLGEDLGLGEAVRKSIPSGRMGTPTDIADACVFLASEASSFVTGACLPVDGGQDAVGPFGALFQAMS